jgi:hypothetical protein
MLDVRPREFNKVVSMTAAVEYVYTQCRTGPVKRKAMYYVNIVFQNARVPSLPNYITYHRNET